jgi:uncharacterized protein DUF6294
MLDKFVKKGRYGPPTTPSRHIKRAITTLAMLCILAISLWSPAHNASAAQSDTLEPGMNLYADQSLVSLNGYYRLQMQGDGNLVLVYAASGVPIWATGTDGAGAVRLSMQLDGNLVLYTARNAPVWASNTRSGRSILRVQGDRNVVIYRENGGPVWATNTTVPLVRSLRWPTLYAGDCEMYNASLFFHSDGTGKFYSRTLTRHAHSGDVWHIRFDIKDQGGNNLFSLGQWDSPRMDEHDPNVGSNNPGDYTFEVPFSYDPAFFRRISTATAYSSC